MSPSFIPGVNSLTRTMHWQLDDTILHIRVDLPCLSCFDTIASLWIGSIEIRIGFRCIPRLLYERILEPRDSVEHKVRFESTAFKSVLSQKVSYSWIGSFQLFMQYAPGIFVGRAFDAGYL